MLQPHHQLRELLTPSFLSAALSFLFSTAILIGSNVTPVVYQVTTADNRRYFSLLYRQYVSTALMHLDSTERIGQVTLFLLWAGVGAMAYIVLWLSINTYI